MKIRHVPIHPDLAMPLTLGTKTVTRRPMKPQPTHVDADKILFGFGEDHESSVWKEDYPCPFGAPGELAVFYFEGNGEGFNESKIVDCRIERLLDVNDEEAAKEGFDDRAAFILFWEQLYGETEFSQHFNPYVWRIQFCKN